MRPLAIDLFCGLGGWTDGHLGMWFIRWWQAKTKTLASLRRRGFAATVWSGVMLTPLGRVLRAHLKEQNNEN